MQPQGSLHLLRISGYQVGHSCLVTQAAPWSTSPHETELWESLCMSAAVSLRNWILVCHLCLTKLPQEPPERYASCTKGCLEPRVAITAAAAPAADNYSTIFMTKMPMHAAAAATALFGTAGCSLTPVALTHSHELVNQPADAPHGEFDTHAQGW